MLRFAYIGTGWWGMELAKNSVPLKDIIEIAGCCSLSEKEAGAFRAAFGGQIFPSYEAALGDPTVDAVLLATPHSSHWQQIIAGAKAKKNVFVEKPLALTVETGLKAVKACEEAHVALGIGHNRRYSRVARAMKAMVEFGECGKILHVEANYSSAGGMNYRPGMWRAKREECPGGGIAPMALHVIDTMTWILGPVARLASICKRQAVTVELDDTSATLFELQSGATGTLGCVFASAMTSDLKFYGTRRNIEARDNFKELLRRAGRRERARYPPALRDRRHGAAGIARLRRELRQPYQVSGPAGRGAAQRRHHAGDCRFLRPGQCLGEIAGAGLADSTCASKAEFNSSAASAAPGSESAAGPRGSAFRPPAPRSALARPRRAPCARRAAAPRAS